MDKLTDFVNGFYDAMLKDPMIGVMLKKWMQTAPHEVYMKHLKDRTIDYLEAVWDGDRWEGQDLFIAHAHLHINNEFFDRAMKCAKTKVGKMGLSSSVRSEIMKEMEVMKEPIVDPGGKFHAWIEKKQKALEAKSAGDGSMIKTAMGFTISKAELDAQVLAAKKAEDRKKALAAEKQKRLAREAEQKKAEETKNAEAPKSPEKKASKTKAKAPTKAKESVAPDRAAPQSPPEQEVKAMSAEAVCVPPLPPEDKLPCVPETSAGYTPAFLAALARPQMAA